MEHFYFEELATANLMELTRNFNPDGIEIDTDVVVMQYGEWPSFSIALEWASLRTKCAQAARRFPP